MHIGWRCEWMCCAPHLSTKPGMFHRIPWRVIGWLILLCCNRPRLPDWDTFPNLSAVTLQAAYAIAIRRPVWSRWSLHQHHSLNIVVSQDFCFMCELLQTFVNFDVTCSQLRHDCHHGAIEQILMNGSVQEMSGSPATQDLLFLLHPLLVQRVDAGT